MLAYPSYTPYLQSSFMHGFWLNSCIFAMKEPVNFQSNTLIIRASHFYLRATHSSPTATHFSSRAMHFSTRATHISLGATHFILRATHFSFRATHISTRATHFSSCATYFLPCATHFAYCSYSFISRTSQSYTHSCHFAPLSKLCYWRLSIFSALHPETHTSGYSSTHLPSPPLLYSTLIPGQEKQNLL